MAGAAAGCGCSCAASRSFLTVYSSARGGLAAMLGFSQPASLQLAGGSYEKAETGVEGGGRWIGDAHSTECVSSCLPLVYAR